MKKAPLTDVELVLAALDETLKRAHETSTPPDWHYFRQSLREEYMGKLMDIQIEAEEKHKAA